MRRASLLWLALGLALPARAETLIEAFSFRGPAEVDRAPLERALAPHIGRPATEDTLLAALADLEQAAPIGGIDFEIDGGRVEVEFEIPPTRIERVLLRVDDARDPRRAGELEWRRLRAAKQTLRLAEGLRFHRYLARLDARTLWTWSVDRGHLDARVHIELDQRRDLTAVTLRLARGPVYRLGDIRIQGFAPAEDPVESGAGDVASPAAVRADAMRVERQVCREGFGAARVQPRVRRRGKVLDVDLVVDPGPPTRIRQVEWAGEPLPAEVITAVGLLPGAPYCEWTVRDALSVARAHLRGRGFYGARVEADLPRALATGHLRVDVEPGAPVHVGRVWFRGHAVTHGRILRQLVSVREGALLRAGDVEDSVENLRRSGLFRRVSVEVLPADRADERYVVFELDEREVLSVDFASTIITLHNMNLYWPADLEAATDGASLRGAGQTIALRANFDWVALYLKDPFLWEDFVATVEAELRYHTFSEMEEQAINLQAGAGLRGWENQFEVVFIGFMRHTSNEAPDRYLEALPIPPQASAAWGGGLDATLDLNAIDQERVPYLGVLFGGRGVTTGPLPGLPLSEWSGRVGVNLPLYANRRGQHGVFLARLQGRFVEPVGLGGRKSTPRSGELPLFAHQRLTPRARGYAAEAIRLRFPVSREAPPAGAAVEDVEMGGLAAYTATLAVRLPLPWRRNALVPFADFARVGSRSDLPWEDVFPSLGTSLDVSLFDERLEGSIYVAWPLRDDVEAEYVGLRAGGSFGE